MGRVHNKSCRSESNRRRTGESQSGWQGGKAHEEGCIGATRARRGPEREPAGGVRANGGNTGSGGGAGNHEPHDQDRRDVPAERLRLAVRTDSARDGGVFQLRQRAERQEDRSARHLRPPDRLEVLRRRLQPGADGSAHEQADPRGQGVRHGGLARNRAGPREPAAAERTQGAASPRLDRRELLGCAIQAVPLDDRLADRLRLRGEDVRALDSPARAQREDRGLLPERRLREGLPSRAQAGAWLEDEPDRLRAQLRAQ